MLGKQPESNMLYNDNESLSWGRWERKRLRATVVANYEGPNLFMYQEAPCYEALPRH